MYDVVCVKANPLRLYRWLEQQGKTNPLDEKRSLNKPALPVEEVNLSLTGTLVLFILWCPEFIMQWLIFRT